MVIKYSVNDNVTIYFGGIHPTSFTPSRLIYKLGNFEGGWIKLKFELSFLGQFPLMLFPVNTKICQGRKFLVDKTWTFPDQDKSNVNYNILNNVTFLP